MDNKLSGEELASEQQANVEVKEDEIRNEIIAEYGFDETTDSDKIEKLTNKEIEHRKKFSAVIGQKIKYRTEAEELKKKIGNPVHNNSEKNNIDLSPKDAIAIMRANVHNDDIDEVLDYAKYKKISVEEAIKSSTIKSILSEREEFRKTQEATSTGVSKRVTTKVTDESLLSNLSKGIVPEKGSSDAERLFYARRGGKKERN